jgi:CubicO group peptidase (beta-lactamase class C family)
MSALTMLSRLVALCLLLAFSNQVFSQRSARPLANGSGISIQHLARIDSFVQQSIEKKELPGAVVLVGHHSQIVGARLWRACGPAESRADDNGHDVRSRQPYQDRRHCHQHHDLIERGEVRLSDPVVRFIPEMKGEGRDAITIEQLLTHTSGFAPDFDLRERWNRL